MTAQEARALIPVLKVEEVLEVIKKLAKNGNTFTWYKLTETVAKELINLDYTVEYYSINQEYRISW